MASWPCYVSNEPDLPDEVITIYDAVGQEDGRSAVTGETWDHHGVQVRVRSKDYRTGLAKAKEMRAALAAIYDDAVTVAGTTYLVHAVVRIRNIVYLGVDSPTTKRHLFVINAMVTLGTMA